MLNYQVVIPVYGRADRLKECLAAIPADVEVILIDDFTPTEQWPAIQEVVDGRRVFRNKRNFGFPYTANKGMSKVTTPYALLMNSDIVLDAEAFNVLRGEIQQDDVGIAAPMLIFPADTEWGHDQGGKIQSVGFAYGVTGSPYHMFLGWSITNQRAVQRRDNLHGVTGACMMLDMDLWRRIGGFAMDYGRGTYEDAEFGLTVCRLGYKIVCNPQARGRHYVGQSITGANEAYPLRQNADIFRLRNRGLILHDEYLYL